MSNNLHQWLFYQNKTPISFSSAEIRQFKIPFNSHISVWWHLIRMPNRWIGNSFIVTETGQLVIGWLSWLFEFNRPNSIYHTPISSIVMACQLANSTIAWYLGKSFSLQMSMSDVWHFRVSCLNCVLCWNTLRVNRQNNSTYRI